MSARRLVCAIALACALAAGGSLARPEGTGSLPYGPGERLDFRLRWQFLVGGAASMSIVALPGDSLWRMTTVARSTGLLDALYPVRDTLATTVDPEMLWPVRFEKHQNEGWFHRDSVYIFDQRRGLVHRRGKPSIATALPVHDTLSLLYRVRAQSLDVGQTADATVYEGGKLYPVQMRVLRRETVTVPAGTFSCLVIEPRLPLQAEQKKKGRMLIWLTDDARRIPVLIHTSISAGRVSAELVSYQPPAGPVTSSSSP